jgi:serine/threonine protein kinase
MSLCLVPECLSENSAETRFCQKCGSKLLLQDRYRAIKIIGQGGFGKTFLARDEGKPSQPYCVIKQFLPVTTDPLHLEKAKKWFKQEAERLDELGDHPQIPELLTYCNHEGRQYLVQEYVDGKNLAEELATNGIFNESEIRGLLLDILPILEFIHSKQVIHRDIKPENIIRRIQDEKLFLVDFGASKDFSKSISSYTTGVIGTAQYAAPEQLRGESRYSSDLYSLGVTCLYLITQINPFDLFSSAENDWVWRDYLNNNNPISPDLGNILDKLIQPAVKKRYQSAQEVLTDLKPQENEVRSNWSSSQSVPPPGVSEQYRQENVNSMGNNPLFSNVNGEKNDFDHDLAKFSQDLEAFFQKTTETLKPQNQTKSEPPQNIVKVSPPTQNIVKNNDGGLVTLRVIAGFFAVILIGSMLEGGLISGLCLLLAIGFWCSAIAKSKGRDSMLWFFLGVSFHVLTLIAIACFPRKSSS